LYATFGVLTKEHVKMSTWIGEYDKKQLWNYLENIKQASDRSVIENLFKLLGLMTPNRN